MKRNEARKPKSRMISFRVDEDDFIRLDTLAHQTSCSRAEVLRRCLQGARLKSTVDAQALSDSPLNERRFRRLRTPAHGVISSPVAPRNATPVRFDFCSDRSESEVHGI